MAKRGRKLPRETSLTSDNSAIKRVLASRRRASIKAARTVKRMAQVNG